MTTLKEEAQAYEPPKTLNIADLESFDVSEQVETREGKNKETGKPFKYYVLVRDDEDYRIPNTVMNDIKNIIAANAKHGKEVSRFAVECENQGTLQAKYTIVTLD